VEPLLPFDQWAVRACSLKVECDPQDLLNLWNKAWDQCLEQAAFSYNVQRYAAHRLPLLPLLHATPLSPETPCGSQVFEVYRADHGCEVPLHR
jgi:hypothetical protein